MACFGLGRAAARVRVRSSPSQSKSSSASIKVDRRFDFHGKCKEKFGVDKATTETDSATGNRIMVVADPSFEAKGALQWALSHTVQNDDTIILVHVTKPFIQGEGSNRVLNPKGYEFLDSMKSMCETKRPGARVEVLLLVGKQKGPIIVEEAGKQEASLLVLGQRKRSITWRLLMRWTRRRAHEGDVEYCIQNSKCMTIAVRRKSEKLGGYLITTKRHKDFWLLA